MDTLVASMSRLLWVVLLWTLGCTYFSKLGFSSFEDTCSRMEVLDHTVSLFLVFWDTPILFSIVAAPIDLPTNSVGGSFQIYLSSHQTPSLTPLTTTPSFTLPSRSAILEEKSDHVALFLKTILWIPIACKIQFKLLSSWHARSL